MLSKCICSGKETQPIVLKLQEKWYHSQRLKRHLLCFTREFKAALHYRTSQNCSFYVHTPLGDECESNQIISRLFNVKKPLFITRLSLPWYFICCLRQFQFTSCLMNGYCKNASCFLQKVAAWIKLRNTRNDRHCGQTKAWSTPIPLLLPPQICLYSSYPRSAGTDIIECVLILSPSLLFAVHVMWYLKPSVIL